MVEPGERPLYVAYSNYSANVRYERPLGDRFKTYGQFDIAHEGDVGNDLRATNPKGFARVLQPAYDLGSLRLGATPDDAHWDAEFYVSNLRNKRAVVFINTGNYDRRETTDEPRVFGVRLKYRLGRTG